MKNSKFIIVAVLVAMFMVILPGCDNQLIEESSVQTTSVITDKQMKSEINWLRQMNFITQSEYDDWFKNGVRFRQSINQFDDGRIEYEYSYPASYDMNFSRSYIQSQLQLQKTSSNARHRIYSSVYTGGPVTVRVHSNVPASWSLAVSRAVFAWNALGVNIIMGAYAASDNMVRVNEVDIAYSYVESSLLAAITDPPTGNKPSERIRINSGYNGTVASTDYSKKSTIMHELGHALGILHTDSYDGSSLYVPGSSCNSSTDPYSIMRAVVPSTLGVDPIFTGCDKSMMSYLWPKGLG